MVTTARVTHATPAAAYAHVANRDWEADTDIVVGNGGSDAADCGDDIAKQLVHGELGSRLKVF